MDVKTGAIKMPIVEATAQIISAYAANNAVSADALPGLVKSVHAELDAIVQGKQPAPQLKPAVPIRQSLRPDYIICLEDGKKFKSLKRHLRTCFNLTPAEYREKWNLPRDYPMVAPNYAVRRSNLAKQMGLGQKGRTKLAA